MNKGALGNFKGLSQDGEREDFFENTRASPLKENLSIYITFSQTHLAVLPLKGRSSGAEMETGFHNVLIYLLQRQNTEFSKQIFPEKEYRGVGPNFRIHASVSDLYMSTIGLPILLQEICRPILGLHKSLKDT
jgi:hypothetical protein